MSRLFRFQGFALVGMVGLVAIALALVDWISSARLHKAYPVVSPTVALPTGTPRAWRCGFPRRAEPVAAPPRSDRLLHLRKPQQGDIVRRQALGEDVIVQAGVLFIPNVPDLEFAAKDPH